MNKLMVFNYNQREVRTVQKDGDPWFVLKDVCQIIGLSSPHKVFDRLDDDERNQIPVMDSLGRNQETAIINESGLYNVILRSDKSEAKPFRKWVTSEVLPSIRKHGAYMTPNTIQDIIANPGAAIELLTALQKEQDEKLALQADLDRSKEWYSIKRVAHMNGRSHKDFDWRKLKAESDKQGYGVRKIFDANYGEVNIYHTSVWENVYPMMEL